MNTNNIGDMKSSLKVKYYNFEECQLNAVRNILSDKIINQVYNNSGFEFRKRLLTPVVTVFHYLTSALWPEKSFQASATVNGINVSSSSLSKARQRLPLKVMESLFHYVSDLCKQEADSSARFKKMRVVLFDGTGISMEDNDELFEEFGSANSKHGKSKYPVAKLVTACLKSSKTILSYRLSHYKTAEVEMAKDILSDLEKGDFVIGDSHYAGANHYCKYLEHGLEFLTPVQHKLKVDRLNVIRNISEGEFIAEVPVGKYHRVKNPNFPECLTLRFIKVNYRSRRDKEISYLVTSLTDEKVASATELKNLYKSRWSIETLFYELKIPLSADVLRSKKSGGIYKEIAAKMMAANLVRCIQFQAAKKHGKKIERVSFINTVRIVISTSLRMSIAPKHKLNELYEQMLDNVASYIVPYRPNRREPRRIRRDKSHYEYLSNSYTRAMWRKDNGVCV